MRIWVDTADVDEIARWAEDDRISGFTTNPSLMRAYNAYAGASWAEQAVKAAAGKPISIDGPPEVWELGPNVIRKMTKPINSVRINYTAVCSIEQVRRMEQVTGTNTWVVSVFVGRIMDTGRDPRPVIDAARQTGAQVLWASVREPYNIVQAEQAGCDIVTVPPAILTKYFDWLGLPLETVAARTIAQFDKDREGLWS
jgi:transaldolase